MLRLIVIFVLFWTPGRGEKVKQFPDDVTVTLQESYFQNNFTSRCESGD